VLAINPDLLADAATPVSAPRRRRRPTDGGRVATATMDLRGRDLLRKIPGVTPVLVTECSGHDGTYAMTIERFESS